MASTRDRARKLAHAKVVRQQARRADRARRRRQVQAAVGAALALLLVVLGAVWFTGGFDRDDPADTAAQPACTWTPQDAAANDKLKDVGRPPADDIPQAGTRPMTLTTNQGDPITVALDLAQAPCSGASLAYLARSNFFDNTRCHEITAEGAIRCGDPSGTGLGGPTYTLFNENVPVAPEPAPSAPAAAAPLYPKGTVALVNSTPGANGSQFLIFFKDFAPKAGAAPQYPIVGSVTGGMATVEKMSKIATVDNGGGAKTKPKTDIVVQTLTVGDVSTGAATDPSTAPSAAAPSASTAP